MPITPDDEKPNDEPKPIAWPSVNAGQDGVDMTVSWSDGREGTPPTKIMLLSLTWDEIIELVEERGYEIQGDLRPMLDGVTAMSIMTISDEKDP